MYSLKEYGYMISDSLRADAYAHALKTVISGDTVVLDIGTGTGIHALLACKFGARKVYAVEPNDAIHIAQKLAQINGYASRIAFIQDSSTNINLPQKADLIVSDLRGVLPLLGQHIPTIVDARNRHLAPGGALIPQRDFLWAALVEARFLYNDLIKPWDYPYGFSMEPVKKMILNDWSDTGVESVTSRNLLTEPHQWAIIDYETIISHDISGTPFIMEIIRNGTAHGWLVWFDSELSNGIGFSNGPHKKNVSNVYGRAFFPLLEPVEVAGGDLVELSIQADLKGDEYTWRWRTSFFDSIDSNRIKIQFNQSTDQSVLPRDYSSNSNIAQLHPTKNEAGDLDQFILSHLDGNSTLEQIAQQVVNRFPTFFDNLIDALSYVYDLSRHYTI